MFKAQGNIEVTLSEGEAQKVTLDYLGRLYNWRTEYFIDKLDNVVESGNRGKDHGGRIVRKATKRDCYIEALFEHILEVK